MKKELRSEFNKTKQDFIWSRPDSIKRRGISEHYVHQTLMNKRPKTSKTNKVKSNTKSLKNIF